MTQASIADYEKSGRVFIVAEVAQAHEGSLGILHSFIDACASAGVDAVKFQIHIAEAESSKEEPFRVTFSRVDANRADYWKRMGYSEAQWTEIKAHCEKAGVEFLATPFSIAAVDLLERLNVVRYKVGSGDIANTLLIERIAQTGKEAILSTGLGTFEEIERAAIRLKPTGVAVLQCTTSYPTAPQDIGLAAIPELRRRLSCPSGLSDHSATTHAGIAAAAVGASIVEAHVTFDRRMFGPDSRASLTVDEFAHLVQGIRFVEKARAGAPGKSLTPELERLRTTFGRTLSVNQDLPAGHTITFGDLECKKPAGQGVAASDYARVVGRALVRPKAKWDFLVESDFK